jgi:hypothetical protein
MKRAAMFMLVGVVGLVWAGPILGETVKMQVKGAY